MDNGVFKRQLTHCGQLPKRRQIVCQGSLTLMKAS